MCCADMTWGSYRDSLANFSAVEGFISKAAFPALQEAHDGKIIGEKMQGSRDSWLHLFLSV